MEPHRTGTIPEFLLPLREQAAEFANMAPANLQQVLPTEYAPGAGIGWREDKPIFDQVVGISLVSPCLFRLRRRTGTRCERTSLTVEPRSAYLLQDLHDRNGSTASRLWTVCATRSRSGISNRPVPDKRISPEPRDVRALTGPRSFGSGRKPAGQFPCRRSAPGDARRSLRERASESDLRRRRSRLRRQSLQA